MATAGHERTEQLRARGLLQRLECARERIHERKAGDFVRSFRYVTRRMIVRSDFHQVAGTRTRPSISTRALRLMLALVTVHSLPMRLASAPTRNVPDG